MNPDLAQRLKDFRSGLERVKACKDILSRREISLKSEASKLQYRIELHAKASELLKSWLEDSLRSNVDSMAALCTSGLRHVIHDQRLTFSIRQEHKNNRVSMRFEIEEDGVEGDPVASFGGGPVLISSLILRLAVMSRMKMGNLLLLDESLHALAQRYRPSAASFLRQLADETGINILMVTHDEEFMDGAHTAYDGDKGSSLRLTRRTSA